MKMALIKKNKMQLLDGSTSIPDEDDPTFSARQCRNTLSISWIMRAVPPDIPENIVFTDRAIAVWK